MWLRWTKKTTICTMQIATHIKNTHRPDAPRAVRLPTHDVDREVIKHRGPSELMAVGVENGGHASGRLSEGASATNKRPVNIWAKRLASHMTVSDALNHRALFSRYSAKLPVADCGHGHIEQFGQLSAPANQARCGVYRVLARNNGDVDCLHACSLTRNVLLNQHHVLTRYVFNNT